MADSSSSTKDHATSLIPAKRSLPLDDDSTTGQPDRFPDWALCITNEYNESSAISRSDNAVEEAFEPENELASTASQSADESVPCQTSPYFSPEKNPYESPISQVTLDDEIIPEVRDICFGMLCDVKCSFLDHTDMDESDLLSLPTTIEDSHQFTLTPHEHWVALRLATDVDLAVIDTKTSCCLRKLKECGSIRFEAFVTNGEWIERVKLWKGKGRRSGLTITINIYGARAISSHIGRRLSKAGLFLQHPRYCNKELEYDNPQFFKLPHRQAPQIGISSTIGSPIALEKTSQRTDIACVLDTLSRHKYLQDALIDPRVRTSLLPHQKEGVYFMTQREFGDDVDVFSLWKSGGQSYQAYCQHIIVGTRRASRPDERCGGILADDMGLGKSLTTLSTIVGSLHHAQAYLESSVQYQLTNSNSMKRTKPAGKATLIVVPSALLLDGWIEQLSKHISQDALRHCRYHGPNRGKDIQMLLKFDIIFTTYATLAAEFRSGDSILHQAEWFRLVLDEAHVIRDQSTKQFHAVHELQAKYRWCLTGTPIQNKLEDLASLIRVLRIPLLEGMHSFRKHIIRPIEKETSGNLQNLRLLLDSVCLRRTKELLNLSEPIEKYHMVDLSAAEEHMYFKIGEESRMAIDRAVCGHDTANAYSSVLRALVRLRLLCNNGTFEHLPTDGVKVEDPSSTDELLVLLQQGDQTVYTHDSEDALSVDVFKDVPEDSPQNAENGSYNAVEQHFPIDMQSRKHSLPVPNPIPDTPSMKEGYSSKLFAVLSELEGGAAGDKSIIFSGWMKTLNIMGGLLSSRGIKFVRIDGSCSMLNRRKVLARFQQDPETTVLLMTLGTGAVGLNLTIANRIHIIEPQWNPSVETQAIGRALRLGQEKQVTITRYLVPNTVEEFIRSRQNRKLQLAQLGWNHDGEGQDAKLKRLMDLRSLLYRNS